MKIFLISCMMFSVLSCGPVVRVNIKGTKDGVTVQTSQTASDSTGLNIQVNPNINFK